MAVDHIIPLGEVTELYRGAVDGNEEFQLTIQVLGLVASTLSTQLRCSRTVSKGNGQMSLRGCRVSGSRQAGGELHLAANRIVRWNTSIFVVGGTSGGGGERRAWRLIPCASRDALAVELSVE